MECRIRKASIQIETSRAVERRNLYAVRLMFKKGVKINRTTITIFSTCLQGERRKTDSEKYLYIYLFYYKLLTI